jgi:hypothetical protein
MLLGCANPDPDTLSVDPISEAQLGGNWRCETSSELWVPREILKTWGHTQGIAVAAENVIISVQVKEIGAILLKFGRPSGAFLRHRWLGDAKLDHPSDLQICENTLAVAVAIPQRHSFSRIYFCEISTLECVGDSIDFEDHVGALAFGRYRGGYYLFGGTWDSDRLVLFRSQQRTRDYRFLAATDWRKLVLPESIDTLKYKYNALHFYPQTRGLPLLYASSGNVLDVWEVQGLESGALKLKKIYSKKTEGYIKTGNARLFHEGMDVHPIGNQLFYFAAPHDFNRDSSRADFFRTPHYYTCSPALD